MNRLAQRSARRRHYDQLAESIRRCLTEGITDIPWTAGCHRKRVVGVTVRLLRNLAIAILLLLASQSAHSQDQDKRCDLVIEALNAREHIHVGDTRATLEKTFELGGGMSMDDAGTYVFKKCIYLEVDVTFRTRKGHGSQPSDPITSIGKLYVDRPAMN